MLAVPIFLIFSSCPPTNSDSIVNKKKCQTFDLENDGQDQGENRTYVISLEMFE